MFQKVDKVDKFWKKVKADIDVSRYLPNILPVTRQNQIAGELPKKAYVCYTCISFQNQIAGELPKKAYASVTYSEKKY